MDFRGADILSAGQFDVHDLDQIIKTAENLSWDHLRNKGPESPLRRQPDRMAQLGLGSLFFEPSTRTRMSFSFAMGYLGGVVVELGGREASSLMKGETMEDTVATVSQYCDVIVIRHPENGSAQRAADIAKIPVINAGDGTNEHPTQALLDLYTIKRELGRVDGVKIAFCGDLLNGRTVHSNIKLLRQFGCQFIFVSPEELKLPGTALQLLSSGTEFTETTNLEEAMAEADVLYMTRIQKERFGFLEDYKRLKDSYQLTREMVERINPDLTIMHPLPRNEEIAPDVDTLPGAAYFRQAGNGLYVRMALLALVAGRI